MHQRLIASLIAVNIFHLLNGQPIITRQIDAGGSSSDNFRSIEITTDGGFIAGGFSNSGISGEKTQASRGGKDYWVIKYDRQGIKQWDKTIGGSADDELYSVLQTNDGGYLLGGLSWSNISGEKTQKSKGYCDYWIVKVDSFGTIQWDKTIGGTDIEFLTSMCKTSDGGYLLGGMSLSNAGFDKTENCRGGYDYWVVKIGRKGKIDWDKTMGGSQYEYLTSVKQTRDSGIIIGGRSFSNASGEKSQNSRGAGDYWIVKLNNLHEKEWDKTIGGSQNEFPGNVIQMPDDGYIICGSSESGVSGEKSDSSRGYSDYWIVKINKRGTVRWNKTIGGSDLDYAQSVQFTKDSFLIIGGYSYSGLSGEKSENMRGLSDYWIIKLNTKGQLLWDKTIGGSSYDESVVIKETGANKYMIGGTSSSIADYDKTQNSRGEEDFWIVNIQESGLLKHPIATTIGESFPSNSLKAVSSLKLFPTVATSIVNVEAEGLTVVSVFDRHGRMLLRRTINGASRLNVSGLVPGVYYLKNEQTNAVARFIIER
ncbi:MAG TPA: T9SS type A sorting domain-containing protein [Parafilimonas sp.]|nr:T9SS type A sorting domain-containing protein [Parafilimonas sp.]